MSDSRLRELLDSDGPAAPPRANGELVFAEPWESRLFGVTIGLYRAGLFEWDEFRRLLIAEIGAWESAADSGHAWSYYECWQAALEKLLLAKGLFSPEELPARVEEMARRPVGHDH